MADKEIIYQIRSRIERLTADHGRLNRQCAELLRERDALRLQNRALQERIRQLEGDVARLQLIDGLGGGVRSRDKARARVNRLMREVDRCIALLNRQPE